MPLMYTWSVEQSFGLVAVVLLVSVNPTQSRWNGLALNWATESRTGSAVSVSLLMNLKMTRSFGVNE